MTHTEHDRTGEALSAFNDTLEATGLGRKQQADLIGEESEGAFRKMVTGHQALPLEALDHLPTEWLCDFLNRLGQRRG
jgi:hypothetical protein